jgi:hypothetical protein
MRDTANSGAVRCSELHRITKPLSMKTGSHRGSRTG